MNEKILVYMLCANLSDQLTRILQMKRQQLAGKPGDIQLSADIRKLSNDVSEMNRVGNSVGEDCVSFLTNVYGCKFQFMVPAEKKPAGVDGKEIKLTP